MVSLKTEQSNLSEITTIQKIYDVQPENGRMNKLYKNVDM
jgi:hypothetical protein